ncbi:hypothetical protein HDA32_001583 [Spinactinospora alkalitolerans]|uniref:DUF1707 domain-containing protein n=1 Tax=Spinactinospora alkalitolerans TaxID=687207 RepID=A0A852TUK4_9ACTN|nr:DUF1707 domain-containing protein [Spinactinospora alkalitolerans]NYE46463.1 hypothetical protein [Spinactinospora alkalitolerans]
MDDDRVPPERLRASDADRDAVAERLAAALSEGRLDLTEYGERLDSAMRAKTLGELAPITADLPPPAPVERGSDQMDPARLGAADVSARTWRDRLEPWRGLAGVSVIMIGIWGVTSVLAGSLLPFWPLWPIGFMFVFALANAVSGETGGNRDDG